MQSCVHWMRSKVPYVAIATIIAVTAWSVGMQRNTASQASPQPNLMQFSYPTPDIIPAAGSQKQTATVILLHGLGDSSAGWIPVGMQMRESLPHVKWVLPTAPMRAITCNMGMKMPGWYDIYNMEGINSKEDDAGVKESARYVKQLIEKEIEGGTPVGRIVVAGFSQGGAVSLMSLRQIEGLAGVVGLSCYLPLRNEPTVLLDGAKSTPVFMGHGIDDPLIPLQLGEMSKQLLEQRGVNVEFRKYSMAHSACLEELQDVAAFLGRVLP
eukprot:jgi/Ulvmu1/6196/UM028_0052.1